MRILISLWIGAFFLDTFFLDGAWNQAMAFAFLAFMLPALLVQLVRGKLVPGADGG